MSSVYASEKETATRNRKQISAARMIINKLSFFVKKNLRLDNNETSR